jgi:hypothetical protein
MFYRYEDLSKNWQLCHVQVRAGGARVLGCTQCKMRSRVVLKVIICGCWSVKEAGRHGQGWRERNVSLPCGECALAAGMCLVGDWPSAHLLCALSLFFGWWQELLLCSFSPVTGGGTQWGGRPVVRMAALSWGKAIRSFLWPNIYKSPVNCLAMYQVPRTPTWSYRYRGSEDKNTGRSTEWTSEQPSLVREDSAVTDFSYPQV